MPNYMAKQTPGRIIYPPNVLKLLALAQKVYGKHQSDGADSALNALTGAKWEDVGPDIATAAALHAEAIALSMQADAKYAERDLHLKPIRSILRASGSYLKALHRNNPKALGDWGYNVDDTPQKRKKKE